MITHRAPQDYENRYAIVSQLEPLCTVDGGHMFIHRDGLRCTRCDGTAYEMVQEVDAADYRKRKQIAAEWATLVTDDTAGLRRLLRAIRNPDPIVLVEEDGERLEALLARLSDDGDLGEAPFETRRDVGV